MADNFDDKIQTVRAQELELARRVNVNFMSQARDYEPQTQYAERLVTRAQNEITYDWPIVMSASVARQKANIMLSLIWQQRTSHTVQLPFNYLKIDPGDILSVPVDGVNYSLLVNRVEFADGLIKCECVQHRLADYTSDATGYEPPRKVTQVALEGPTESVFLDIPVLRDNDTAPGFYVGSGGFFNGWRGCVIYRSNDGGETYDGVTSQVVEATYGACTTTLASGPTTVWDKGNRLTVRLENGTLSSVSEAAIYNFSNFAAVGAHGRWELIQFANATLNGDGTYTIFDLLRGRQGTEHNIGNHTSTDTFILLESVSLDRVEQATAAIGSPYLYKSVSIGDTIDETDSVEFTNTGVSLKPLSPVLPTATKSPAGTITFGWKRRARLNAQWADFADVALDETVESYEIDIMNGAAVKRTLTAPTPTVAYTLAQQQYDWGGNIWSKIGGDGVGSSWNGGSYTVAAPAWVSGKLYAATQGSAGDGEVWRLDGATWTKIGGDGLNSGFTGSVSVRVYDYSGTVIAAASDNVNLTVWSWNGSTWTKIGGDGVNSSWATNAYVLVCNQAAVKSGLLYMTAGNNSNKADIWTWSGSTWAQVGGGSISSSWADGTYSAIQAVTTDGTDIYAGPYNSSTKADVWKLSSGTWSKIGGGSVNSSWADSTYTTTRAIACAGSTVYVSQGSNKAGLWAFNTGTSVWTKIAGDGVNGSWSSSSYLEVRGDLIVQGTELYYGVGGAAGDGEVWKWDGALNTKIAGDALNGSWNGTDYETVAFLTFDGTNLYASLGSTAGSDCEIWKLDIVTATIPNPISIKVYQISGTLGRGYALSATLSY